MVASENCRHHTPSPVVEVLKMVSHLQITRIFSSRITMFDTGTNESFGIFDIWPSFDHPCEAQLKLDRVDSSSNHSHVSHDLCWFFIAG